MSRRQVKTEGWSGEIIRRALPRALLLSALMLSGALAANETSGPVAPSSELVQMASAKPAASGQRKRSSGTGNAQRKGGKTYLGPALVATVDRCERGEAVLVAGTSAPVVFFVPRKSFLETCLEGQQVRLRLVADWPHLHPEIGGRVLRLEIARWESDLVWVWHGTRAFRLPATLWRRPQMRDTRLLLVIDPIELEMPVYPDEPVEVPALTDGLPLVPPREAGKSDQGRGMRGAGGKPEPSSLSTAPAAIPAGS